MHNLNIYLFTFINQGAGQYPLLDGFFIWLTTYITFAGITAVIVYLLARPFFTRDPLQRLHRLGTAAEAGISLFFTWVIVYALKILVAEPRPFVVLQDAQQLVHAMPYQSFPSSHAALTMAVAIAVLPYHKHLGHLLIVFSLMVSLSRLYVGVHYPFDIGVGLMIGYLVPKIIHRVFAK